MADEPNSPDHPGDEPSLELPSLRWVFRRRKTRNTSDRTSASRSDVPRFPQPATRVTTPVPPPAREAAPDDVAPPAEPRRRGARRPIRLRLPGPVAAALTGAVVGLALVGLTSAALDLCTTWRGTAACGKPGILLLFGITVVVTALGAVLLRLLGVATAASTSLLGVGLLVVVLLLALVVVGDRESAAVAVPLTSLLTHLVAWWLTTTYDEPGERPR